MASKSVSIVALLFSVLILCLLGTYADLIQGWEGGHASASASASSSSSASGAIEGGFGNGNWDGQGYGDDEERTAAPRKKRFKWKNSLHDKFLRAIAHSGFDKAKPKKILAFMNEPNLTISQVASHWQKYRIFLKEKDAAAGDEDELERLRRSSFARERLSRSVGSTFQVQPSAGIGSTLPLTAAASNSHGSIPPLIRSGQSSLLNNNPANFPRQQPTLGNRHGDQLVFQENRPAAFGMQQPSNNFEYGGNVENSNGYLHGIFMMLLPDEQDNYQPPSQQQDGGHDQLPYQVEVPDPATSQVPNLSADQVPNPGPYHVEDNALNETNHTWFSYLSEDIWDADIWEDGIRDVDT